MDPNTCRPSGSPPVPGRDFPLVFFNCLPLTLTGLGKVAADLLGFDPWGYRVEYAGDPPDLPFQTHEEYEAATLRVEVPLARDSWYFPMGKDHLNRTRHVPVVPMTPIGCLIAMYWLAARLGCPLPFLELGMPAFRKERGRVFYSPRGETIFLDVWVLSVVTPVPHSARWEFTFLPSEGSVLPAMMNVFVSAEAGAIEPAGFALALALLCQQVEVLVPNPPAGSLPTPPLPSPHLRAASPSTAPPQSQPITTSPSTNQAGEESRK